MSNTYSTVEELQELITALKDICRKNGNENIGVEKVIKVKNVEDYQNEHEVESEVLDFCDNLDANDIALSKHLGLLESEKRITYELYQYILDNKHLLYSQIETYIKEHIHCYGFEIWQYTHMIRSLYPNSDIDYRVGLIGCHDLYTEALRYALENHIR